MSLSEKKLIALTQTVAQKTAQKIHFQKSFHCVGNIHGAMVALENGLKIAIAQDPRAPIFAYQTWFSVGSKHEHPEFTGRAHFLEHLMFKGTAKYPQGTFDREMEVRGAQTNAATWVDWTYYMQSMAARGDNLQCLADFEADRMAGLLFELEGFTKELEVVKNERRQTVDGSVVAQMSETLYASAFPGHGYSWPTIGTMEHLQKATMEELQAFYREHYAPHKALVVVVGDLDFQDTLITLANAYGALPKITPKVPGPLEQNPPKESGPIQIQLQGPAMAEHLLIGYPAPAENAEDYALLEMLSDTLVIGDSARLYRRLLVQERLVSDIEGYMSPFAEPGLYEFLLILRPGVSSEEVLRVLDAELDKIITDGPSPHEINKAAANLELSHYDSLKDAEGLAETIGHYETNYGDLRLGFERLSVLQGLDADKLKAVAKMVFDPKKRIVVRWQPASTSEPS